MGVSDAWRINQLLMQKPNRKLPIQFLGQGLLRRAARESDRPDFTFERRHEDQQIGIIGHPRAAAYSASKAAINGLVRSLALELAPRGVRANAVARQLGLHTSILILAMVVLGGMGSIAGSVLGAVILTILPEMLRKAHAYQELIYGGLLMLLLIWRPEGLLGRGKLSLKFLKREG